MSVYLGSDKVGITKELGDDRLQWKCDNVQSLYYEFGNYKGDNLDILQGLDTSKVTNWGYAFQDCENIIYIPSLDLSSATSVYSLFSGCRELESVTLKNFAGTFTQLDSLFNACQKLKTINGLSKNIIPKSMSKAFYNTQIEDVPALDTSICTNFSSAFSGCPFKIVNNLNTTSGTNFSSMFYSCSQLETLENINLINASSIGNDFIGNCTKITNLKLYNIKKALQIGRGDGTQSYHWGQNLTNESIIHTYQQLWDLTGTTAQRLTIAKSQEAIVNSIYVKLVDVTDEMIAQDQYAANKKPCVVCESTDEGSMTLTEYATSKNWTISISS